MSVPTAAVSSSSRIASSACTPAASSSSFLGWATNALKAVVGSSRLGGVSQDGRQKGIGTPSPPVGRTRKPARTNIIGRIKESCSSLRPNSGAGSNLSSCSSTTSISSSRATTKIMHPTREATWRSIRRTRMRDALWKRLHSAFDPDTMERRIIRTHPHMLNFLNVWVDYEMDTMDQRRNRNPGFEDDENLIPAVPEEVREGLEAFLTSDEQAPQPQMCADERSKLRFLLQRLVSGDPLSRGPAHFPSTYLRLGPQYPFQPGHYLALQKRAGSLKGHELTKRIHLKGLDMDENGVAITRAGEDGGEGRAGEDGHQETALHIPKRRREPDLWRDGCFDQEDFLCDRKRWYANG
ncbi:unnamed protein product [Amoebophrya sp. A25]|nr:unnamed protein product [Amoebophrya sp. A25]|eukprot:GSA25T00007000001.1